MPRYTPPTTALGDRAGPDRGPGRANPRVAPAGPIARPPAPACPGWCSPRPPARPPSRRSVASANQRFQWPRADDRPTVGENAADELRGSVSDLRHVHADLALGGLD